MLSCKDLLETVKTSFSSIKEVKKRQRPISLVDTLMSGYALFSLKYPSLLQFDRHHREDMISHNLEHIFGILSISQGKRRIILIATSHEPLRMGIF